MKSGYRCAECGKFVEKGNKVYIVKNEQKVDFPVCTIECGKKFIQKSLERIRERLKEIKEQSIEEDIW